ncbi:MAG TPA: SDR family NAD(P)-dependent oxidoreductase, partial [Spirochaetota bacterium]|nr:SDR family NAD(P)-dependent oxidoreductase [Spirochaetota bacterium]
EIKKAAAKVMNQLDTIKNIRALESLGVTVKYHAVDVTDGAAVKKIVTQYEKIDGVIHAAGVEESQLIAKKDYSTFNMVFDTKIDGARSLINAFDGKKYRYFMAFSSVAARFGNDGQTDYSAANEMLARMLQAEKRAHADRVYKIYDWTAWGEVGMATKESVMKFLASQGMKLMPVRTGIDFFMNDLLDTKDDEVVITNVMAGFDRDGIISVKVPGDGSSVTPFLGKVIEEREGYIKFSRVLDVKNDIFLLDHARDGVPLFLGSTGVETMAEAAKSVMGSEKVLVEMRDFTIPYGIKILQGKPKEIIIEAKKISDNEAECSIISVFMKDGKPMGEPTLHYKGVYRFADAALPAEKAEIPALKKVEWDGNLSELLYHPKRLFMHGNFDSIKDITGADESSVIAVIHNTHKGPFFSHITSPEFISDPVVVDGAFQTCGFVEFINGTDAILPYRIKSMKFFRPMDTHGEYLCIARLTGRDDAEKTRFFNVDLVDRSGNLFFRIEGFHMIAVEKVSPENSVANKFRMV